MKLIDGAIHRPVTVTMAMLALVVFGAVSYMQLSTSLLPDLSYPALTVITEYAGTAPAEIENLITRKVEESLGVLNGVVNIRSVSRPDVSEVTVEFDWGTRMAFASLNVREKLDQLRLPRGASRPLVVRYDPASEPVLRIACSGREDLLTLRELAERKLKPGMETVDGIAAVQVSGGREEELRIHVDEAKLASMALTIEDLQDRLQNENINRTGGEIRDGETEFLVRTMNDFSSVEEMEQMILGTRNDRPILLADVASITRGFKEQKVLSRLNGRENVELAVYKTAGSNTVTVAELAKSKLEEERRRILGLGYQLDLIVVSDASMFIKDAVQEVLKTSLMGGVLAMSVLFLFLREIRSTMLVGLAIPISIATTFLCMRIFQVNLNIMSLGGLALGVGMLVDNAIVVLESIHRAKTGDVPLPAAVSAGAGRVARAVAASTLTTICVFVPLIFVEGVAGQLFTDQALTVTFSLLASLLVALTLLPMLEAKSFGPTRGMPAGNAGSGLPGVISRWLLWYPCFLVARVVLHVCRALACVTRTLVRPILTPLESLAQRGADIYPRMLAAALRHGPMVLLGAMVLLAGSLHAVRFLGAELIPEMFQGRFDIRIEMPQGTPLAGTIKVLDYIERLARGIPGVATVYSSCGTISSSSASLGGDRENLGQIQIILEKDGNADLEQTIMQRLRASMEALSNVHYEVSRPSLFSAKSPVEVYLSGKDLQVLEEVAADMVRAFQDIPGLVDVRSSMQAGVPEMRIYFDRNKVAMLGADVGSLAQTVRHKVQGEVPTEYVRGDDRVDIRILVREEDRRDIEALKGLVVNIVEDRPVTLGALADIRLEQGAREIRRVAQERTAIISANLSGMDLAGAMEGIVRKAGEMEIPKDFHMAIGGQRKEMYVSFQSMRFVFALALFLVYFVMASQFESLIDPLVIMASVPFSLTGVVLALLLTRTPISVIVLIGGMMLAGIVVNNAIVMVDQIKRLREAGLALTKSVMEGSRTRLRPIMMTTATTVLGLFPMAMGLGRGAEIRRPLAMTVMGGLLSSTLLTLILVPVIYHLVHRRAMDTQKA